MLSIELINKASEFEGLRDEWTDILEKSAANSIYLTNEWLHTWWQVYGGGSELFILTVRDDESLVGIAPLMIRRYSLLPSSAFSIRQMEFLGVGEVCSDHLDFIIKKGVEEDFFNAVFDFIIKSRDKWDFIKLTDIDKDSDSICYLEELSADHSLLHKNEDMIECPYIMLPGTVEEYRKSFRKKTQKKIRKYERRLRREFDLKLERIDSSDSLDDHLDELIRISRERWNKKGMGGSFSSQRLIRFSKKISRIFVEKGWLDLCFINLNGKKVAYFYSFRYNGRSYAYQTSFDPTSVHPRYSVGTVIVNYCIEHAIEEGYRELDWGRGADRYKMRYATGVKETVSVRIGRKNLKGILMTPIFNVTSVMKNFMIRVLSEGTINKIKEKVGGTDLIIFR